MKYESEGEICITRSRCVDNINMDLTEFSSLAVVNVVTNLRNP
jgi:hypothetical protein